MLGRRLHRNSSYPRFTPARAWALYAAALGTFGSACARNTPEPTHEVSTPIEAQKDLAPIDDGPAKIANPEKVEVPSTPKSDPLADLEALNPSQSTSLGNVLEGSLLGGVRLPERAPGMVHNPKKDIERAYGTVELIRALVRAGKALSDRPESEAMVVNDLSHPNGGPIDGHSSHRAGRDVDLYFPLKTLDGKPYPSKLIPLDPKLRGTDYHDLKTPDDDIVVELDLDLTWSYLSALLSDPEAKIQQIFVVQHVQQALARYAKKSGASAQQIQHFLDHSCQPNVAHDDHMHIRFYCSAEDIAAGCEDNSPIDREQLKRLRDAGVEPKIAQPAPRARRKPKITTPEEARKRAGELHRDVVEFLEARKQWTRRVTRGPAKCPR